jgi:amidohydrolase
VLERAREIEQQLIDWRRDFHMHPELGFQETRTADKVAATLESLGYRVKTQVGRTGVVGERGQGHPIVALRADMDALPIQDEKDVPYASQVPNVMHACGHDAHTAMLLGVAKLLSGESFPGTVRLLFQPAEEVNDEEGVSGAPRMVEDGAMAGVDMVFATHVNSAKSVGDVMVDAGPASAGADSFYATIVGKGGHGSAPHKVVDPIYIGAHVALALHGIVSRRLKPSDRAVISIGSIHAGDADNVIPERLKLSGTIRFMEPEVQERIHAEIRQAMEVARAMGGDYDLEIEIGCPPMINAVEAVKVLRGVAADFLGAEHILDPEPGMGAEDFGSFTELAPGAMFSLGAKIEEDERSHHHPRFDIDERCLPIGAAILAEATLRRLRGDSGE